MSIRTLFLVAAIVVMGTVAFGQAPFGVSAAELGSATLAGVTFNNQSSSLVPSGASYVSWTCSNGCMVWDFPLMSTNTRRIAIFAFGDWRVAAYCDKITNNGNPYDFSAIFAHPCDAPGLSSKAWIELRKEEKDLSVLFESCRKKKAIVTCKDPKNAEKDIRRFAGKASLYHIISVHNVKTDETWPKQLSDFMKK